MRRFALCLLATSVLGLGLGQDATAAPPRRPAPPPMPVIHDWTGFYAGAHVGWAWMQKDWGDTGSSCLGLFGSVGCASNLGSHSANALLGGGQVGVNFQKDIWVFGLEGQFSFSDLSGSHSRANSLTSADGFSTFTGTQTFASQVRDLGTLAARIAVATGATGDTLFFLKGGASFAHDDFALNMTGVGFCPRTRCSFPVASSGSLTGTQDRWGWMFGFGIERVLWERWSGKIEYDFLGLGTQNASLTGINCVTPFGGPQLCSPGSRVFSIDQNIQLIKIGINYHFGAMP
ncbi:MAG TPA: outer membrane beta-barrel protein [Xanthobacteraceae bacterium]